MEVQTFNKLSKFNNITDKHIINIILNKIYDNLNIGMFGYRMFEKDNYEEYLNTIIKEKYLITPHIMGINCWLLFIEYEANTNRYRHCTCARCRHYVFYSS